MGADGQYDVFISYNHSADSKLANALRDGLQQFARPWNRRRAMRVFLDRASLEASASIGDALEERLKGSRYLILLASRESAASTWCERETSYWVDEHGTDTLLIVLTDAHGRIEWDDGLTGFDPHATTALPPNLLEAFDEVPLWTDLRWVEREGTAAHLDLRSPQFRDAIATLAATIHGVPKDELDGEDVRQHRRFQRIRRLAIGALAALTIGAVVASIIAFVQYGIAKDKEALAVAKEAEATERARIATIRQLAASARSNEDLDLGLLLAVQGAALLTEDDFAAGEDINVIDALVARLWERPEIAQLRDAHDARVSDLAWRNDELLSAGWDGSIRRWTLTLEPLDDFAQFPDEQVSRIEVSPAGDVAAIVEPDLVLINGDEQTRVPSGDDGAFTDLTTSRSGDIFAVKWPNQLWRWRGGDAAPELVETDQLSSLDGIWGVEASPIHDVVAVIGTSEVILVDTTPETGDSDWPDSLPQRLPHDVSIRYSDADARFLADGRIVVHAVTDQPFAVLDPDRPGEIVKVPANGAAAAVLLSDGSLLAGDNQGVQWVAAECLDRTCIDPSGSVLLLPRSGAADASRAVTLHVDGAVFSGDDRGQLTRWEFEPAARVEAVGAMALTPGDSDERARRVQSEMGVGEGLEVARAFSPSGDRLAVLTLEELILVDVDGDSATGTPERFELRHDLEQLETLGPLLTPTWSPNEQWVGVGDLNGLEILEVGSATWHRLSTEGRASGLFSADSRFVVTVAQGLRFGRPSGTRVQLHTIADERSLGAVMELEPWIEPGELEGVGPGDRPVIAWDGLRVAVTAALADLIDQACAVATRTLTEREWETFLGETAFEPACVDGRYAGTPVPAGF